MNEEQEYEGSQYEYDDYRYYQAEDWLDSEWEYLRTTMPTERHGKEFRNWRDRMIAFLRDAE